MRIKAIIVGSSLAIALWVTLSTLISKNSARQITDLRADIDRKREENERLTREISELKTKLKDLAQRTDVKEKLIRDETGFVRPDEMVFQFAPSKRTPREEP